MPLLFLPIPSIKKSQPVATL